MMVTCPTCQGNFQSDSSPAQWCPHCGAENYVSQPEPEVWVGLAGAAPLKEARRPAAIPPTAHPSKERMDWFHCRVQRWWGSGKVFRAYFTSSDLIFVNLGITHLSVDQQAAQMGMQMGGGAIPALIGTMIAHRQRGNYERLDRALQHATPDRLREYVADDRSSFVLPLNEITLPRIERATFWSRLSGTAHKALLSFHHVGRGDMTLEVVEREDIGKAIPAFVRHFREDFAVRLTYVDALK